jgi:hypothetical protein
VPITFTFSSPFPSLTSPHKGFQEDAAARYGPMSGLADNGGRVHATATTNAQARGPASDAPASSESLKTLARRCILDPGTRVDIVRMESSGCGRLKVMVMLEVADTI